MDETELDEVIRRALSQSSEPPTPPLDNMWRTVERKHFGRAAEVVILPWRKHAAAHWGRVVLPAAATLVLGLALGRYSAPRERVYVTRAVPAVVAQAAAQPSTQPSTQATAEPTTGVPEVARGDAQISSATPTVTTTESTPARVTSVTQVRLALSTGTNINDDAYSDEVSRYLARTTALLATLPASEKSAEADATVADRAGTLLTQTHLLLDSRVGSDPTLHRLLEDLELVLAQVARLHQARGSTDLQLIHEALQQRDVLPRLHDATIEAQSTD
ncbi:MAG: hypothetical protein ACR2M1_15595 [Gemmatimonadaceae bacterium]